LQLLEQVALAIPGILETQVIQETQETTEQMVPLEMAVRAVPLLMVAVAVRLVRVMLEIPLVAAAAIKVTLVVQPVEILARAARVVRAVADKLELAADPVALEARAIRAMRVVLDQRETRDQAVMPVVLLV
jgi:hypothetical protein